MLFAHNANDILGAREEAQDEVIDETLPSLHGNRHDCIPYAGVLEF